MKNNCILALSGNDIFSGGGLSADLATYTLNGLHGFVAVTCLTALTEKGFEVFPTDDTIFQHELDSLRDVDFAGIKIGLLPTVSVAEKTLDFIKQRPGVPVVLDPVLVCKETHDVAVSQLCQELIRFFPHVSVITPNLPEAELLADQEIKTLEDMKAAAQKLHDLGLSRSTRKSAIIELLQPSPDNKKTISEAVGASIGLKWNANKLFEDDSLEAKGEFSNKNYEEQRDEVAAAIGDNHYELVKTLESVYQ